MDGSAEAAMREKLVLRYNTVRPFLSLLGESHTLDAAPAGRRILKAVRRLPALSPAPGQGPAAAAPRGRRRTGASDVEARGVLQRQAAAGCVDRDALLSLISAGAGGLGAGTWVLLSRRQIVGFFKELLRPAWEVPRPVDGDSEARADNVVVLPRQIEVSAAVAWRSWTRARTKNARRRR